MKYDLDVVMAYFKEVGLPAPTPELKFHPVRRWRFDFAWEDKKVALEVEGGGWTGGRHTRGSGFAKDILKYNSAALLGWVVVRTTPQEVCMQETVDLINEVRAIR